MTQNTRYLCFNLGQEEFAIPLLSVREVLGLPDVTPVPQTAAHFIGIMNLRGQVISVMDLRTKLSIKPSNSEETAVIILDLGHCSLGMVVDRVVSVLEIPSDAMEKPSMESSKASSYVEGVFKKEDYLILVLDIGKALSVEDRSSISKISTAA